MITEFVYQPVTRHNFSNLLTFEIELKDVVNTH